MFYFAKDDTDDINDNTPEGPAPEPCPQCGLLPWTGCTGVWTTPNLNSAWDIDAIVHGDFCVEESTYLKAWTIYARSERWWLMSSVDPEDDSRIKHLKEEYQALHAAGKLKEVQS